MPSETTNKSPTGTQKTTRITSGTAASTNRPATRNETRRTGQTVPAPAESGDVHSAADARAFLENKLLLCPPGEPMSLASLAMCLQQVARMSGITRLVSTAVQSVALLVEEMEETAVHEFVRDAVNTQLKELTLDMEALIEHAKEKIDDHLQKELPCSETRPSQGRARTYADVAANPPPHANPRLAAKEGIRARQFMLEGIKKDSKLMQMSGPQLRNELNSILGKLGHSDKKFRSAIIQRHKGILLEAESDDTANWLKERDNQLAFCSAIGTDATFKPRVFSAIAYNVPVTFDPTSPTHKDEICEVNNIAEDSLQGTRWVKPVERRKPGQKTAHLVLTFSDANEANRIIANGIVICSRRVMAEKIKKEPVRCLKCQGWNHYAYECIAKADKCGNCAQEHRTRQCPNPDQLHCVSCNAEGHASWSRDCPVFRKKLDECNRRNPENSLHFIPTKDPWTWLAQPEESQGKVDTYRPGYAGGRYTGRRNDYQQEHRQTQDWDTYIPIPDWNGDLTDWTQDDNRAPHGNSNQHA